jgi:hypothetical protein
MSDSGTARFPATVRGEWKAVFHKGTRSSLVPKRTAVFRARHSMLLSSGDAISEGGQQIFVTPDSQLS